MPTADGVAASRAGYDRRDEGREQEVGMTKQKQIDRMMDAFEMKFDGATYGQIGDRFGVSAVRAAQIVRQALREFGLKGKVDHIIGVRVSRIEGA